MTVSKSFYKEFTQCVFGTNLCQAKSLFYSQFKMLLYYSQLYKQQYQSQYDAANSEIHTLFKCIRTGHKHPK